MTDRERIEELLEENRGYVVRNPDASVVLFSGGPDSTVSMVYCMEELDVEVYPLFVRRGQGAIMEEESSVDFFDRYLRERYPDRYNEVRKIDVQIPPYAIKKELPPDRTDAKGYPLRDTIMDSFGVQYATTLGVTSVFLGAMPEDPYPHSQLVALRSHTLSTCINMGEEWDWQVTAPATDPELGEVLDTEELLTYADRHDIPHEKTFSS